MDLLKHLGFFRAVADVRHFGNAAADLGMTQPPLSQGIRRLERHLGVRLFDRDARGVRITAAGRRLLPAARDLLDAADDLVSTARDLALPEQVRLGIAADLEDGVPYLLRSLASGPTPGPTSGPSSAGTLVAPTVAGSVEVVDLLRDGLLDVGVVRHPGVLDGLAAGPVLVVPTRLVRGPDMTGRDADARQPTPADVPLPVAVPPRHHQPPAHDQLIDALRRAGHSGDVVEARDAAQRWALGAAAGLVPVLPDGLIAPGGPAGPPLRLRVALPLAAQRRPEVDHEAVAQAVRAALGPPSGPPSDPVPRPPQGAAG
ncbi:LysR family transcriptional regulator [Promicromonospora iranensis]|uniref:DNA-binding transcriptional LysR family regulator n=1 Tax=Promicromonospora iranensis TaxID=1105144 RepID=A0ABU2CWP5_9MICO|nr:LysR family transcriptional regulator [Promicromonospora iranensis]MDR7385762.1 DNA-binding transcriptional LysR family regulator [Promicromonospora iranensis]